MELLIIIIISLLLIPLAFFTSGVIRIILGLLFVVFSPGYVLIAALFPQKDSLSNFERVALSFGLSIAVVPLIGLIMNYTPWGVTLYSMVISIFIFISVMAAFAWYRRQKLILTKRFSVNFKRLRFLWLSYSWASQSFWNKVLIALLILAVIGTLGIITYVSLEPKTGELFTEFYILGEQGNAENYPKEVTLGENINILLGIVNNSQSTQSYQIEITINGESITHLGSIYLAQAEKWEQDVSFSPIYTGVDQKVEFLLFIGENTEPYEKLHLWINVKEPQ